MSVTEGRDEEGANIGVKAGGGSTEAEIITLESAHQRQESVRQRKESYEDRKFNLVIYGIEECSKGTRRQSLSIQDLEASIHV